MLVSPPTPTSDTPGARILLRSQSGGSPMSLRSSRTSDWAWGMETGFGEGQSLKFLPCTCWTRTDVAMPEPTERIHDSTLESFPSALEIWKEPPPESHATMSVGAIPGHSLVAVRKPRAPSCSCETIFRFIPSALTFFKNSGPFSALRNAAVAAPPSCSAPAASASRLKSINTCINSCKMPLLNAVPTPFWRSSLIKMLTFFENTTLVMAGTKPACMSTSATRILLAPDPTSNAARRTYLRPARSSASFI
mmetsp:Transcript_43729/g.89329  ORF Transcript_43729/g.89329 Transcript_43729/m.89329 type:complete len:250 (+) Transcript_43729:442-1191(+)